MITEQEYRDKAEKETKYCLVLSTAWLGEKNNSLCLERIFTKARQREEIRLAWWKDGRQMTRPADIDAEDWISLFTGALGKEVFTDSEKWDMVAALNQSLALEKKGY